MHLYLRIAVLMAVVLIAKCSGDVETQREARGMTLEDAKEISDGHVTLRDGRRLKTKKGARLNFGLLDNLLGSSLLDIIDFSNGNCSAAPGSMCMSQKECLQQNGTYSDERCVEGLGVCCSTGDTGYTGGDVEIGPEGGDFTDPAGGTLEADRPDPDGTIVTRFGTRQADGKVTYTANLKPPTDAVQIKVVINNLYVMGPDEGDCVNDTLTINGANPGLDIPVICGRIIDPQTLYVDIDNSEGPYSIVVELLCCVSHPAEFSISISYLTAEDAVEMRCLQYFTETTGTIKSLNYDGDSPMMINDLSYSICFAYVSGYCDIAFTFSRLDLGSLTKPCGPSYLLIGDHKFCGDFIDGPSIIANATGPINVGVRSGGINEIEAEGFSATYTMLGCS